MEFKAHTCRISLLHEDIRRAGHKDHWMASQNLNGFTKLWPSINSKRTYCQHWPQATLKMKAMWLCSGRGEIVLTSPLFLWYFYQESQNTYRTGTRMKSIFPLSNKSQLSLMFSPTVSEGKGSSFRLQLEIWLVLHEPTRQDHIPSTFSDSSPLR